MFSVTVIYRLMGVSSVDLLSDFLLTTDTLCDVSEEKMEHALREEIEIGLSSV